MNKLEVLISEALQKFPSEDIRELVAKETGLTVEQVSEKMNEAAKAAGSSFPAETFALLKDEEIVPTLVVPKEVCVAEDPPKYIPTITYKKVFLPKRSSSTGLSDWNDTLITDMVIQEEITDEGADLLTVAIAEEFANYYVGAVVENNTIRAVKFKSLGDLNITEFKEPEELLLTNGSVIFFAPKN